MNDSAQRESRNGMITLGLSAPPAEENSSNDDVPRALTLTNLLLVWCFISPFAGAMGFAKAGKCGVRGFIIALLIGLPLGTLFVYAMWKGFRLIFTRVGDAKGIRSIWTTVWVLAACFTWIAIAGLIGSSAEEAFFPKQSAYLKACRATHTCLTPQTSGQQ